MAAKPLVPPQESSAILYFPSCFAVYNSIWFQKIDAADFVNYGVSPLKNTLYEGSDDEYHYFSWSNGKNRGRWKLLKSQMRLACEIQYGTTGGMPLVLSNSGDYVPYSCREAR